MSDKTKIVKFHSLSPKKPDPSDSSARSIPIGRISYSKERKLHFDALVALYRDKREKNKTQTNDK